MKYRKQIAYILSVILITGLLSGAILANAQEVPYTEESSFGETVSTVSEGGLGTTTGPGVTVTGPTISVEPATGPTISVEPVTGSGIVTGPGITTEPPVTDTPSPAPIDTPQINVNVKSTFLGVKAGKKATATLSVVSLTDEQGEELEDTGDFVYNWCSVNKKKVEGKTYKAAIKKPGLYEYYCEVTTKTEPDKVIGKSETVSVVGYQTNLSVTLPKNQKGGVSSAKLTSDAIRNQLLGLKKKVAKSISINKISVSKKADKTNKKNLVVNKNKSVKVKTYLKGGKAKNALTITVKYKNKESEKEFTIKNITVESKLKELPAANVTMKLSQKNTLLTVTFKKVKGISYIKFGPTGKKPAKIVKKANKSTYVVKFRNKAGFKSKEFRTALGYKTKYGVKYSSYVKKGLKNKKKK